MSVTAPAGEGGAEARTDALRRDDSALGQVEMSGAAGQIGDDEWEQRAV